VTTAWLARPERAASVPPTVIEDSTPATDTTTTSAPRPMRIWPATPATVTGAGSTWTFGETGDVVVLGDWDCDGVATPALLRPPSGAIWVVDAWPAADELRPRLASTIPGATAAVVEADGACDVLVVGTDGGELRLSLRAPGA
jgi:hypothetical protein